MEVEVKVLGIDPGLQVCGYACLETGGGREVIVEAGVIKTTEELPLEARLKPDCRRHRNDPRQVLAECRCGRGAVTRITPTRARPS